MERVLTSNQDEMFKKMVFISAILHVTVILMMTVKTLLFPSQPIDLDQAIRVDIVALPDKMNLEDLPRKPEPPTEQESKDLPKPEKKKVEFPPPTKVDLHAKKQQQKKEMADAMSKIRELEQQEAERQRKERLARARAALIKGNQISAGTSLKGIQKAQFDDYVSQIHEHIQKFWDLPEWLRNDSLKAVVVVKLNESGIVLKRVIEKSSGDPRFDAYVLRVVDNASPFPRPPEKFIDLVRYSGIALGFPE